MRYGHVPGGVALDCIGLVSRALRGAGLFVPPAPDAAYHEALCGQGRALLRAAGLLELAVDEAEPGDILYFVEPHPHLAVRTGRGMVHADLERGCVREAPIFLSVRRRIDSAWRVSWPR